jgi:capsid protein
VNPIGDQNLIQFLVKELGRQLRGYPLAYSIINLARNDDTHTDAITHRAVMESIMMGVMKGTSTDLNQQARNLARKNKSVKAQTQGPSTFFRRVANAIKLGAGNILTIQASEDFEFTDLKTPSNIFGDYKDWMVRYVAQATGTPPEVIKAEYSTSYTAHKGALNDFTKAYMKRRKTFERSVMDIVIREIAKDAIGQGLISAPGFFDGGPVIQDAYLAGMYLGPVPGHINPLVEVKADSERVKNAFTLRSDIAEKNGHDWDIMVEEWAEEQDEFTSSPQTYLEKQATEEI